MKKTLTILLAAAIAIPGAAYAKDQETLAQQRGLTQQVERHINDRDVQFAQQSNRNDQHNSASHGNDNRGHDSSNNRSSRAEERSQSWHKFTKGERFERSRAQNYSRLDYGRYSRLRRPPSGYVWVRSGGDALMVRLADNIVAEVVSSLF